MNRTSLVWAFLLGGIAANAFAQGTGLSAHDSLPHSQNTLSSPPGSEPAGPTVNAIPAIEDKDHRPRISCEALRVEKQRLTLQVARKDRKISSLKAMLAAAQHRYNNENVARLVAEKNLKIARSREKQARRKTSATNKKLQLLAGQLEKNQQRIAHLEKSLAAKKL